MTSPDLTAAARAEAARRETEARFQAFVTASSDVVYRMSPDWSEMLQLDGRGFLATVTEPTRGWLDAYIHPDDQGAVQAAVAQAIETRSMFELEHRLLRADGSFGWTRSRAIPILDEDGRIVEWLGAATDVTASKRAEFALRDSEARYRAIVEEAADYAIFTVDPERRIETWPAGAQAVFGWAPEEAIGQLADIVYTPEDIAADVPAKETEMARDEGVAANVRWHVRKGGGRVFIEGAARARRSVDGAFLGTLKIGRDATDRHRSDERQRLLLAELQHRVRNTLAIVRSIARRSGAGAETVEAYAMHLDGRINALARTQAVLTRSPGLGVSLEELISDELLAYAASQAQVSVSGPEVRLQPKAAETLGLAVHELATNAVKYGALSTEGGQVAVTWTVEAGSAGSSLRLEWTETGVSIRPDTPRRRGFGRDLIERTVPYELGATVEWALLPGGACCRIGMPMTARNVVGEGEIARGANLFNPLDAEGGADVVSVGN